MFDIDCGVNFGADMLGGQMDHLDVDRYAERLNQVGQELPTYGLVDEADDEGF